MVQAKCLKERGWLKDRVKTVAKQLEVLNENSQLQLQSS